MPKPKAKQLTPKELTSLPAALARALVRHKLGTLRGGRFTPNREGEAFIADSIQRFLPTVKKWRSKIKRLPPLDAVQPAATIFAMVAATDEEFAAGLPLTNPGKILAGSERIVRSKRDAKLKTKFTALSSRLSTLDSSSPIPP